LLITEMLAVHDAKMNMAERLKGCKSSRRNRDLWKSL
jgi:hypothetical protein